MRRRTNNWLGSVEGLEDRQLLAAIQVTSSPGPKGSTNLTFLGTDGRDLVFLRHNANKQVLVNDPSGGTFQLDGGPLTSQLTFAKVNNLSFDLGGGMDGARVGVPTGNITIQDGADGSMSGYAITNSPLLTSTKVGDIQATFSGGPVFLEVVSNPGSTGLVHSLQTGKLNLNLNGTTQSTVNLTAGDGSQLLMGDVSMTSPDSSGSEDSLTILARTGYSSVMGQISIGALDLATGGGLDRVNSTGAVTFRSNVNVNLGAGEDGFVVSSVSQDWPPRSRSVANFQGSFRLDGGAGATYVSIASSPGYDRIRFQGPVSVQTGDQRDTIHFSLANFTKDLTIQTGDALQIPSASSDLVVLWSLNVLGKTNVTTIGAGEVHVDWGFFAPEEPSNYQKAVKFALGSGTVTIGNPSDTQVRFGSTQTFIGVNSQITVSYIGSIVANLMKRILINAVLT